MPTVLTQPRRALRLGRTAKAVAAGLACVVALTSCSSGGGGGTAARPGANKNADKNVEAPGVFPADSTMAAIQKRGKLIVGIRDDAAPFSDMERTTGTWSGFDVEIAKEIAIGIFGSQLEGRIEWVPLDPRDRELALEQKRVDIALGRYAVTVPRKRFVDFAGPYYIAEQEVVIPNRNSNVTSVAALNGRKICVIVGSTNTTALTEAAPQADLSLQVSTPEDCAAALSRGQVDAFAGDHVDMLRAVELAGRDFRRLPQTYASEPYGIGVNKQQTDLRRSINDRLEKIDPKYRDIFEAAINDDAPPRPPVDRY